MGGTYCPLCPGEFYGGLNFGSDDFPHVGPPRWALVSVWGVYYGMLGREESAFVGRVVRWCVCEEEEVRDDSLQWVTTYNSVFRPHAVLIQAVLNSSVLVLRDSLRQASHHCSHFCCYGVQSAHPTERQVPVL